MGARNQKRVEKIFIFGSPVSFSKELDGGSGRSGKTAAASFFILCLFVFLAVLAPTHLYINKYRLGKI